jgi:hypothetical protein
LAATAAWAQPPLPLKRVPEGFKVITQRSMPTAARLDATRPNSPVSAIAVGNAAGTKESLLPLIEALMDSTASAGSAAPDAKAPASPKPGSDSK